MEKDLQIKDKVKERYGKIAPIYTMNSTAKSIDYNPTELESIPQSSILGVRCGNPTKFAHLNDGISDLVTYIEIGNVNSINAENWCSCIDRALTKERYIESVRGAGFTNVEVLDEKPYLEMEKGEIGRQITRLAIKAIKK
jgi:hypothetical protein